MTLSAVPIFTNEGLNVDKMEHTAVITYITDKLKDCYNKKIDLATKTPEALGNSLRSTFQSERDIRFEHSKNRLQIELRGKLIEIHLLN